MLNETLLEEIKILVLQGRPLKESHKHFIAALIEQHKQAVLSNEFYLGHTAPGALIDATEPRPAAVDIPHSER